jgi:hypothetical protein
MVTGGNLGTGGSPASGGVAAGGAPGSAGKTTAPGTGGSNAGGTSTGTGTGGRGSGGATRPVCNSNFEEFSGDDCTAPEPKDVNFSTLNAPFLRACGTRMTKMADWRCQRA